MSTHAKVAALLAVLVAATAACSDDDPAPGGSTTTSSGSTSSTTTTPVTTSTGTGSGQGGSGGVGGSGGSGGDPWLDGAPSLTIAECVDEGGATVPNMGNEGHLAAVRLTPESYPYEVSGVAYVLAHGNKCSAKVAHRVELYVDTNAQPSNMPTIVEQIDVPALASGMGSFRLVEQPLAAPITLSQGESLFVAVELAGTPAEHACIMNCAGTGDDDRNYWSNATAAPYNWATLASFGNATNLRIGANGSAK